MTIVGYKGRSLVREIQVYDEDGNKMDITGYGVTFILYDGSTAVLTKNESNGITILDAAHGLAQLNLTPTDTANLLGTYTFEVDITLGGDVFPVEFNAIIFKDPTTTQLPRVPTYCSVEDVVARLQLMDTTTDPPKRKVLDEITNPKASEVESRIMAIEDYIERFCWDNWRIISSGIEFYSVDNLWPGWFPHELTTFVAGCNLQTFDASKGDILQVRQGDTWIDLLDGVREEGIGKDFWCEYTTGLIHFYRTRPQYGNQQVRVKYRWGNTVIPYDISRAASNLVAADLLRSELYAVMVGEGSGYVSHRMDTAEKWEAEARDIMLRHKRAPIVMCGL